MIPIYSKHHFLISVLGAGVLGIFVADSPAMIGLVVVYAGVLGVGIDLDHFVISRLNSGNWEAAKRCFGHPVRSLLVQGDIFEEAEVRPSERILSHLVISGLLVPATWAVEPRWGLVSGVVLYLHILTDAVGDAFDLY